MPRLPRAKTTHMMEQAVYKLAEIPEGTKVFITGAHSKWLREMEHDFKEAGLMDVEFLSPSQILNGALLGRDGVLLIDDFSDLSLNDADMLLDWQKRLEAYLKGK